MSVSGAEQANWVTGVVLNLCGSFSINFGTVLMLYTVLGKIQKFWICWVAVSQKRFQKRSRTFMPELVVLSAHIAL